MSTSKRCRSRISCKNDPRITEQAHAVNCNVNRIVDRFAKTRTLPEGYQVPQFGDANPMNFQEAMDIVARGNSAFAELPAEVRKKFHHNPAEFVEFVTNPENGDALVELGLATKRELKPKEPLEVKVINPVKENNDKE